MFTNFALLCPGAVLLIWTVVLLSRKKDVCQMLVAVAAAACTVYFSADGIFLSPETTNPCQIGYLNLLRQIFGPMLIPIFAGYYRAASGKQPLSWQTVVWFALCLMHFVTSTMLFILIGPEQAGHYLVALNSGVGLENFTSTLFIAYKHTCVWTYNGLMIGEIAYMIVYVVAVYRNNNVTLRDIPEVWRGCSPHKFTLIVPSTVLLMLLCMLRRILGDGALMSNMTTTALISLAIAATVHVICYVCNIRNMEEQGQFDIEADETITSISVGDEPCPEEAQNKMAQLALRFPPMMEEEQIYLRPSLTAEKVAKELGTNHVYLQRYVTQNYNMNFNEYVNRQRIKYAQALMLKYPDALLEYISSRCGYLSTSAFSKNFQRYVGLPPRLWLMNQIYLK